VPRWLNPVGLVHANIRDWASFIAFTVRSHPANPDGGASLLQRETAAMLFAPDQADATYAAGWYRTSRAWAKGTGTGAVLMHQGDNAKWSSAAYVAPEIGFAVLIVCNRAGMADGLDEIAQYLVANFAGTR